MKHPSLYILSYNVVFSTISFNQQEIHFSIQTVSFMEAHA